jgi:hypothetical protein
VELYEREEVMWRQRSRVQWLAEGDKNTRSFHLRASQRRKKNRICRLKWPDGEFTDSDHEMAALTRELYADLYRSEGVSWMEEVVSIIFNVPCLFYTNCFVFCLHFMAFLYIFWN